MRIPWLLAILALGCRRQIAPGDAGAPARVAAELSGCDAFAAPGTCEVVDGQELRVVIHGSAVPDVRIDGAPASPMVAEVAGDRLLRLKIAGAPTRLEIGSTTFTLAASSKPAWLREATALRKSGKLDEAQKMGEAHLSDAAADGARARGLLARVALARGETERAVATFRESIASLAAFGRWSEEADDRFAASWALSQVLLRFDEARSVLESGATHLRAFADGRAREPYYRALASMKAGDLRGALQDLGRARGEDERLGLSSDARDADETIANTLLSIGRVEEARARLEQLEASGKSDPPCRRADRLVNLAMAEQTALALDAAAETSGRAIEAIEKGCPGGWREANARLDLARTELLRGRIADARRAFDASRALVEARTSWLVAAQSDVEARLALRENKPKEALAAFDREEALARTGSTIDALFRALVGRAEALEALGKDDEAIRTYVAAEKVLDDAVLLVPIGEGRALFAAMRDRGTRGLVDALVRKGRVAEAFETVRRARARALRGLVAGSEIASLDGDRRAKFDAAIARYRRTRAELDASAAKDWTLPPKELEAARAIRVAKQTEARASLEAAISVLGRARASLPPLAIDADTVVFAVHPAKAGFVAFTATRDAITAKHVDTLGPELFPKNVKRLRVLASAAVDALDTSVLATFDGAVGFSLDLQPAVRDLPTKVLIASDPDGNLPSARIEGDEIERVLREGWKAPVVRLHQTAVTRAALVRALSDASVFHFAGHGRASEVALETSLSLSDGRLTIADVVSLDAVPSSIVLTACEAARTSTLSEGLGLAQAFVVAGARVAVAPVRPIADATALEMARAIHAAWVADRSIDLVEALHRAQRSLRARNLEGDWGAFRAITR